mmetsp:Transcript_112775/g.302642  ORF Transcript_112775/g.302642 Transcript_112775/m.302642 type:complete len:81 (+) Transcript_112775:818-1060(+)
MGNPAFFLLAGTWRLEAAGAQVFDRTSLIAVCGKPQALICMTPSIAADGMGNRASALPSMHLEADAGAKKLGRVSLAEAT